MYQDIINSLRYRKWQKT